MRIIVSFPGGLRVPSESTSPGYQKFNGLRFFFRERLLDEKRERLVNFEVGPAVE